MTRTDLTLFHAAGGEPALRPAIADLVRRLVTDPMIGFHFKGIDPVRLEVLEWQVAARALGADLPYEGRPLQQAHARHRILDGQFARRTHLLREVMADHGLSTQVQEALLAHSEDQRDLVVVMHAAPGRCDPSAPSAGPLVTLVTPRR
jgi:truncated hemoglobin YjbI